eukprot:TRINITY_DN532_c0_g1_i7.p1 TRINITY_DN532_c0_g1~~TRINITY_DN532_c0_g1_i7.p1  ORF type:complete len:2447 (+),score=742.50 TRINITY_DN532_c0_g1_i7:427-7767(+)
MPRRAIDGLWGGGDAGSDSCMHTNQGKGSWWEVDFGASFPVSHITIVNRIQNDYRLVGYRVSLLDEERNVVAQFRIASPELKYDFHVEAAPVLPPPTAPLSRYLRIDDGQAQVLHVCEVEARVNGANIAPQGTATQSSEDHGGRPSRAIDGMWGGGDWDSDSCMHTKEAKGSWWEVDFGDEFRVSDVTIVNRFHGNYKHKLVGYRVRLLDGERSVVAEFRITGDPQLEYSFHVEAQPVIALPPSAAPGHETDACGTGEPVLPGLVRKGDLAGLPPAAVFVTGNGKNDGSGSPVDVVFISAAGQECAVRIATRRNKLDETTAVSAGCAFDTSAVVKVRVAATGTDAWRVDRMYLHVGEGVEPWQWYVQPSSAVEEGHWVNSKYQAEKVVDFVPPRMTTGHTLCERYGQACRDASASGRGWECVCADEGTGTPGVQGMATGCAEQDPQIPLSRYLRIDDGPREYLYVCEVEARVNGLNIAPQGFATQSSVRASGISSRAIDDKWGAGYWNSDTCMHTEAESRAWLEVDFGASFPVSEITIANRGDSAGEMRKLVGYRVSLLDEERNVVEAFRIAGDVSPRYDFYVGRLPAPVEATPAPVRIAVGNQPIDFEVHQGQAAVGISVPTPVAWPDFVRPLALRYIAPTSAGSSGDGLAGADWHLGGLSRIARCARTWAHDAAFRGVRYDHTDAFCLDGQRLMNVSGQYGADGSEYRTVVDQHSRVTAHGSRGGGPERFVVMTRDNGVEEYGGAAGGAEACPAPHGCVQAWLLTTSRRHVGTAATYDYLESEGVMHVVRVAVGERSVSFDYEEREDVRERYDVGALTKRVLRLASATAIFHGKEDSRLVLSYTAAAKASRRSLLESVQRCAGTECLRADAFTYDGSADAHTLAAAVEAVPRAAAHMGYDNGWRVGSHTRVWRDVDGDGLADLVGVGKDGTVYVSKNLGHAEFAEAERRMAVAPGWPAGADYPKYVDDVDGNGLPDIVSFQKDGVYVARNLGNGSFAAQQRWCEEFGYNAGWRGNHGRQLSDVDGDGLLDIVAFGRAGKGVAVAINNGAAWLPSAEWLSTDLSSKPNEEPTILADVTGDGLPDLVAFTRASGVQVGRNTGTQFVLAQWFAEGYAPGQHVLGLTTAWGNRDVHPRFVQDVNGDGLADIVAVGRHQVFVSLSTGAAFADAAMWNFDLAGDASKHVEVQLADMNADGLADLVRFGRYGTVEVALNNAKKFEAARLWATSGKTDSWDRTFRMRCLADIDGNGILDVVSLLAVGKAEVFMNRNQPLALASFQDSFGTAVALTYTSLAEAGVYEGPAAGSYPALPATRARRVVATATVPDGAGGANVTEYRYGAGRTNVRGLGWEGFAWTKACTGEECISQTFAQEAPLTKLELVTEVAAGGALKATTGRRYRTSRDGEVWQVVVEEMWTAEYETDGAVVRNETVHVEADQDGNPVRATRRQEGGGRVFTSVVEKAFAPDRDAWWVNKLISVRETHADEAATANTYTETRYEYDSATRQLVREVSHEGSPLAVAIDYSYDTHGNLVGRRNQSAGGTAEGRFESWVYGGEGALLASQTNGLGHTVAFHYDHLGRRVREVRANGAATVWTRGAFGDVASETRADGTAVSYAREWDATVPLAVYRTTERMGSEETASVYDAQGRVLRAVQQTYNGTHVFEDTAYTAGGHVRRHSAPYHAAGSPSWATYEYDVWGRRVSEALPDGAAAATEHHGLETVAVDAMGRRTRTERDARGLVVKVTDALDGVLAHEYDAAGQLVATVDPLGFARRYTYDEFGRRVRADDPDIGVWEYQYNAFGEVVWQRDAKGQVLTNAYDTLGRRVAREDADGRTTWTYDSAVHGVGQLAEEAGPGDFSKAYEYDSAGRVVALTTRALGDALRTETFYNAAGAVAGQVFPSGETVYNCYGPWGWLRTVQRQPCGSGGDGGALYSVLDYDAAGRVVREERGSGLVTESAFDIMGRLVDTATRVAGEEGTMRRWRHVYDRNGNLLTRADGAGGVVEQFEFDDLDRVVGVVRRVSARRAVVAQRYMYDAFGNIVWQSRFGGVAFEYAEDKPSSLLRAGPITYEYDANGNAVRRGAMHIEYTAANLARSFADATGTRTTLFHGPDRTLFAKSDADGTTMYVGKAYERHRPLAVEGRGAGAAATPAARAATTDRHYVYVEGKAVAVLTTGAAGAMETHYLHHDVQGSVDMVSDVQGRVLEHKRYDLHGSPREAEGLGEIDACQHEVPLGAASTTTARGYTGHAHIFDLELINMGARMFDPAVGRFLSADSFVQDMNDAQALNRYAYVRNNPLKNDDPTGFFWRRLVGIFLTVLSILVPGLGFLKTLWTVVDKIWTAVDQIRGIVDGFKRGAGIQTIAAPWLAAVMPDKQPLTGVAALWRASRNGVQLRNVPALAALVARPQAQQPPVGFLAQNTDAKGTFEALSKDGQAVPGSAVASGPAGPM